MEKVLAQGGAMTIATRPSPPSFRDAPAVAELCVGIFRRDMQAFYPQSQFEPISSSLAGANARPGADFKIVESSRESGDSVEIELFGVRYRLTPRAGSRFSAHDRRMIGAIGAVLNLRYYHLFQMAHVSRLELYRGGSEDHY